MVKDPDNYEMTADIWFKDGGSVKDVDVPSEVVHPTGKFIAYWKNETDMECVHVDNVARFVLKNATEAEEE